MPQMISYGRELIRIGSNNRIEYSTNDGRTWNSRFVGSNAGTFHDLLPFGKEIIAATSRGVYVSSNEGRTWNSRFVGSNAGDFISLMDGGRELLANTSKGLYYSTNEGRTWNKRR